MGDLEDRSVNTAPAGDPSVDVGTAEDVEAVMKKYDRESNTGSGPGSRSWSFGSCWLSFPCSWYG